MGRPELFPILFLTVFDLSGNERLIEWRKIRNTINNIDDPYQFVLEVWKQAPLVNQYLNPNEPNLWPDPWHLILDNRYDDLALALGIVYTLGLSERFMLDPIEIYMSISEENNFFVVINKKIIDIEYRIIRNKDFVLPRQNRIWCYQYKS